MQNQHHHLTVHSKYIPSFAVTLSHHEIQSRKTSSKISSQTLLANFRISTRSSLPLWKREPRSSRFLVAEKEKIRWCYVWGMRGMRGKSGFSLRHKVEDDIGSVAWRIIGVNDEFAFACWNQSLTDRN
jgi:hypothetical protein